MHVTVEIALELREFRHRDAVRGAAVGRRGVSVRELPNDAELVASVAMLALHHPNRVLNCTERAREWTAIPPPRQFANIREEHTLLLHQVLLKLVTEFVEGRGDSCQLRMPFAVDTHQLPQVMR